jgi:hypothetical protein
VTVRAPNKAEKIAGEIGKRVEFYVTVRGGTAVWPRRRPNSSCKTGLRPRADSSGTASTILAGPTGALGFTGELDADLFEV